MSQSFTDDRNGECIISQNEEIGVFFVRYQYCRLEETRKLCGRLLERSKLEDRVPLLTKNDNNTKVEFNLMFIGPCIIVIVEE